MQTFILAILLCTSVLAIQAPDNKGTEFMLLFLRNYVGGAENALFISAEQTTNFEVRAPALSYLYTGTVNAGQTVKITLPGNGGIELVGGIENKGISVKSLEANKELTVIGFSRIQYTTDAYVGLPIDVLDTEHVLAGYTILGSWASSGGVVAVEDNTQVTIYPSSSVSVGSTTINNPNSQTFTLNRFQTLYITSQNDVTGTRIVSNKPVGVVGGHQCADVQINEYACDHLIEWMPPVNTWANEFFTVPLATRTRGDVVRVMTNEDGNQITMNGVVVATINKYQWYETIRTVSTRIQTSKPALVMQYSRGSSADGVTSDPFQMWVPTAAQYSANYFITALNGFDNWINLVIESGKQGGLNLDGAAFAATWSAIPGTSYVSTQLRVSAGFHSIFHNSPIVPFGVFSYGWASYDSYGYPGGMRLAPLQDPCTVTVTVAGDGIDNDCDGRVDEELRNGVDDDGDGRVDEDLATPPPQSCCEISQTEPFFTGSAPSTTIQCSQAVPAVPSISATVDCPEPTTSAVTPTIFETPGSCADQRTITRRWIASDECGRSASLVQTIEVVDTVAPTVVAPADKVVECGQTTFGDSATASDLCAGNVGVTLSDISGGNSCATSITRTWTAVDHCGNSGTDTQVISVVDTTAPTTSATDFCVFPPNGLYKCFDVSDPAYVTGNDVCNNDLTFTFNDDCTNANTGDSTGCVYNAGLSQVCVRASTDHASDTLYTFSFTVSDSCGNSAVQPVHVNIPNTNQNVGSCVAADTCIADCADYQCATTTLNLYVDDVQVGVLNIRNKLNWEVSFEFITFEGAIPDRGWWMTGIAVSIGDKRVVKDFAFGNYQSRWFEAVDAFPLRDVPCGAEINIFAAVQVTNDKRNVNGVKHIVYPSTEIPLKRSFTLPTNTEDYDFTYTLCCECTMRTQTQNDFGNICQLQPQRTTENARVREIACYTDEFWTWSSSWCFPNGITVGCDAGNTATWTTPASLQGYLADETSAHVLAQDYVDPPRRTVGYLAAELAALALNIKLDECDSEWSSSCSHLRDLTVCQHPNSIHNECQPYWGSTIGQIFDEANSVVGGCSSGNVQQLFQCVRYINRAFVDGKRFWESPDFLAHSTCQVPN